MATVTTDRPRAHDGHADAGRHVHLVLLGPRGVGKTTVGRLVANRLQRPFVDSDSLCELHHGAVGRDIEAREGPDARRAAEADVFRRVLDQHDSVVFAAAPGVIDDVGPDTLDNACSVWLDASAETLAARGGRAGDDERRERARAVADLWLETDELDAAGAADRIVRAWHVYRG